MNEGDLIKRLNSILEEYKSFQAKSKHNDLSDLPKADRQSLVTRGIAAINQITGSTSVYAAEINRILVQTPKLHLHTSSIMGVVQALKNDIEAGYIQTLAELIHGELFADFLEMAQYLCEEGYKDAAAVITGSTLESHIRKLCNKTGVSIEQADKDGNIRSVKADSLNSELAKADAYSKLDQKNVTAWLGLRNKAAHGQYSEYTADQVVLFFSGVRDFIARIPA